jgi:hypothetical protein
MTTRLVRVGNDLFQVIAILDPTGSFEPVEVIYIPEFGLPRVVGWSELNEETKIRLQDAFQ